MKLNLEHLSVFAFFAIVSFILGGCSTPELQSKWRSRPITIDGFDTEWAESIVLHDKKSHLVIGMVNDSENLYIRLSSFDKTMQTQLLGGDFTIWFDPSGGNDKTLGVQFPIGGLISDMRMQGKRDKKAGAEIIKRLIQDSQEELKFFVAANSKGLNMLASNAKEMGIRARIGMTKGFLVYELKMPLICKDVRLPFEISGDQGQPIGIGFEAPKPQMAAMQKSKGESQGGKSGSPGGMGGRGGKGGSSGRGEREQPCSLEIWAKVYLADPPQSGG